MKGGPRYGGQMRPRLTKYEIQMLYTAVMELRKKLKPLQKTLPSYYWKKRYRLEIDLRICEVLATRLGRLLDRYWNEHERYREETDFRLERYYEH